MTKDQREELMRLVERLCESSQYLGRTDEAGLGSYLDEARAAAKADRAALEAFVEALSTPTDADVKNAIHALHRERLEDAVRAHLASVPKFTDEQNKAVDDLVAKWAAEGWCPPDPVMAFDARTQTISWTGPPPAYTAPTEPSHVVGYATAASAERPDGLHDVVLSMEPVPATIASAPRHRTAVGDVEIVFGKGEQQPIKPTIRWLPAPIEKVTRLEGVRSREADYEGGADLVSDERPPVDLTGLLPPEACEPRSRTDGTGPLGDVEVTVKWWPR